MKQRRRHESPRRPHRAIVATLLAVAVSSCVVSGPVPGASMDEVCSHIRDRGDMETCRAKVRELASPQPGRPAATGIPVRSALPLSGLLSWWAIYYGFGVILARAVFVDARRRDWLFLQIRPLWWGAMCIADAAFGVLVYWVVHYSRLAPRFPGAKDVRENSRVGGSGD